MNINDRIYSRILYIIAWIPLILIPVAYLLPPLRGKETMSDIWNENFTKMLIAFFVLFAVNNMLLRFLFQKNRPMQYVLCVTVLLTAFFIFSYNLQKGLTPPPPPVTADQHDHPRPHGPNPALLDIIIALLIIGSNLSIDFYSRYMREKRRYAELERERMREQLQYLKAQLNPHFFMNMLNNIHGLVEIDPGLAQESIMELSKLMRYVLYDSERSSIPLDTEIDFIRTYVALMEKRYSRKRIKVSLPLPDRPTGNLRVPPLLLIVPVENAFKHGVTYNRESPLNFSISINGNHLTIVTENLKRDDAVVHESTPKGNAEPNHSGIGLSNLRKRLDLLYEEAYSLLTEDDGTYYRTTMTIPAYEQN